jgi:molecular chaperone GrpE (heat shock protein)
MMKSLSEGITTLKNEQAKLRGDRKRVAAELKNAQRRKQRLRTKTRQLSNEDILAVLLMRQEQGTARAAGDLEENASACISVTTGSGSAPSSSSPAPMPEQD